MKLASHMQEGEKKLGSVFRGDQQCSRIKVVSAVCEFLIAEVQGSCRLSWTSAHIPVRRCVRVWNNSPGEQRKEERKRRSLTRGARVVSRCSPQLVDEDWYAKVPLKE